MRAFAPLLLFALAATACHRSAPSRSPELAFDEAPEYRTDPWADPPPSVAERWLPIATHGANEPGTFGTLVLDPALSKVATVVMAAPELANEPDVLQDLSLRAGSPYAPVAATIVSHPLSPERIVALVAAVPGRGPLRVGVAEGPRETTALVFARQLFVLPQPVPRHGATQLRFELSPDSPRSGAAVVLGPRGPEHTPARRDGASWVVERNGGFEGTVVAIVGASAAARPSPDRIATDEETLGVLELGTAPKLPGHDAASLPEALLAARTAWGGAPLTLGREEAPPCGTLARTIGEQTVTLQQRCITWLSSGDDAERFVDLAHNPQLLASLIEPQWQLLHVRRDATSTSVRLGRAFVSLTEAQVRDALVRGLEERWPTLAHVDVDAALDTAASRWATLPRGPESDATIADETAAAAARWTKTPRWYRLTWSDQELPRFFEHLQLDETPQHYSVGVARGEGAEGEPRYFVVLLLSLPAAP
ncbi:MAG: hypothetical protein K1X88_30910 [Nannocystaceae bacterium]|nr:hypothetical protein [Nannocystaceae bacterium]